MIKNIVIAALIVNAIFAQIILVKTGQIADKYATMVDECLSISKTTTQKGEK